jgi:hypothetical protein
VVEIFACEQIDQDWNRLLTFDDQQVGGALSFPIARRIRDNSAQFGYRLFRQLWWAWRRQRRRECKATAWPGAHERQSENQTADVYGLHGVALRGRKIGVGIRSS